MIVAAGWLKLALRGNILHANQTRRAVEFLIQGRQPTASHCRVENVMGFGGKFTHIMRGFTELDL